MTTDNLHWTAAPDGYQLALDGAKLLCKNAKGKLLTSVPKPVRESDAAENLIALRDWLAEHALQCRQTVEAWMLRSLPVPRAVIAAVWPDAAWRGVLENAVVAPVDAAGVPDLLGVGLLRAADATKGLGIVNLDGETVWLAGDTIALPHPILLPELNDLRGLLGELGLSQGLPQLFRETYTKPKDLRGDDTELSTYSDGEFEELNHAWAQCRKLGYRCSGGNALCQVFEGDQTIEARYWLGDGDPVWEAQTGDVVWVDRDDNALELRAVGPVAWSEGVRMAAAIYAARQVESEDDDA